MINMSFGYSRQGLPPVDFRQSKSPRRAQSLPSRLVFAGTLKETNKSEHWRQFANCNLAVSSIFVLA